MNTEITNNIIYHNQDLDGFCSGAIIKYCLLLNGVDPNSICMIGWNYGDIVPELLIGSVYITDICFPDDDMIRLSMNPNLYVNWIDHHKTSIEASEKGGWDTISGSRKVGDSASLLAWKYYFHEKSIPSVVKYVDLYDVWKKYDTYQWQEVMEMQWAMRFHLKEPNKKFYFDQWKSAFKCGVKALHKTGKDIYKFIQDQNEVIAKTSFDIVFKGFLFKAVNYKGNSEVLKSSVKPRHDAIMMFHYDVDRWRVSLYANESNLINIDLSVIAKEFGGGGHAKACGFEIKDINNIINSDKHELILQESKLEKINTSHNSEIKFASFIQNLNSSIPEDHFDITNLSRELGSLAAAIQLMNKLTPDDWMWEREGNIVKFTKQ